MWMRCSETVERLESQQEGSFRVVATVRRVSENTRCQIMFRVRQTYCIGVEQRFWTGSPLPPGVYMRYILWSDRSEVSERILLTAWYFTAVSVHVRSNICLKWSPRILSCSKYDMTLNFEIVKLKFNPLNAELNPICPLLTLLGAHHFLHLSRIRVKSLTLRLLILYIYIYGAPILDVSRSHTTTHHSR